MIVGQRAARATLVHKSRTRALGPGLWWEFVLRASCVVRVGPCEDLFAMKRPEYGNIQLKACTLVFGIYVIGPILHMLGYM